MYHLENSLITLDLWYFLADLIQCIFGIVILHLWNPLPEHPEDIKCPAAAVLMYYFHSIPTSTLT